MNEMLPQHMLRQYVMISVLVENLLQNEVVVEYEAYESWFDDVVMKALL